MRPPLLADTLGDDGAQLLLLRYEELAELGEDEGQHVLVSAAVKQAVQGAGDDGAGAAAAEHARDEAGDQAAGAAVLHGRQQAGQKAGEGLGGGPGGGRIGEEAVQDAGQVDPGQGAAQLGLREDVGGDEAAEGAAEPLLLGGNDGGVGDGQPQRMAEQGGDGEPVGHAADEPGLGRGLQQVRSPAWRKRVAAEGKGGHDHQQPGREGTVAGEREPGQPIGVYRSIHGLLVAQARSLRCLHASHAAPQCRTMDHAAPDVAALIGDLLTMVEQARDRSRADPFGSPVLATALAIMRRMDAGTISLDQLDAIVRQLRDEAFAARAGRLSGYLGGLEGSDTAMEAVATRLVRPDPDDSPVPFRVFRTIVERTRFAAVFTAHPTFSLPREIANALALAACGQEPAPFLSHRPSKPALGEEFDQAVAAISHGRDAIDTLTGALLRQAAATWPDRWRTVAPKPVILTTWVGYDTDGRTDIGWWDTLRLRLVMKRLQLSRARHQVGEGPAASRLDEALAGRGRPGGGLSRRARSGGGCRVRQRVGRPAGCGDGHHEAGAGPAGRGDRGRDRPDGAGGGTGRAGQPRAVARAHTCAAERGAVAQCGPGAAGVGRPPGRCKPAPGAAGGDWRGAGHGATGAGGFRRHDGRAGVGRAG